MRELIKYSFLAKIRDLSLVFWPLVFPLVLTTAMYISIGQMEESDFETIPAAIVTQSTGEEDVFQEGEFFFDFRKMEFLKAGRVLELSRTEQKLLRCLLEHKGRSVSRSQLIDQVWQGDTEYVDEHALTVVVNRLRGKLGDGQNSIQTVYGVGGDQDHIGGNLLRYGAVQRVGLHPDTGPEQGKNQLGVAVGGPCAVRNQNDIFHKTPVREGRPQPEIFLRS